MAVRTEEVIVRARDLYTGELAQMAIATRAFRNELDQSSRAGRPFQRAQRENEAAAAGFGRQLDRNGKALDSYSSRLGLITRAGFALGPAVLPVAALAGPALAGVAAQLGAVGLGIGSLVAASQGVGTAVDALEKARLDPTVDNLSAARDAMAQLGPDAREFVAAFDDSDFLGDLRDAAAAGWFPGLTDALDDAERLAPVVGSLLTSIGTAGGNLVADAADSLVNDDTWRDFFAYLDAEAAPTLTAFGQTLGNIATGLAELTMAADPLSDGFTSWLVDASADFATWADGLSQTEGFQDFVDYVRENGPKVAETAGAIGDALVQVAQAAAPLGGPVLDGIATLARLLARLADSPLGTPLIALASGLSAVTLATKGWRAASATTFGQILTGTAEVGAGLDTLRGKAGAVGSQLAQMGLRGGAGALALGYVNDSLSIADSLGRSQDAADATSDSLATLTYNLQQSNVGKWAADLGYDVNTLAQDLYENGRSGEYVSAVMADLEEHSSGVGATLNAMGGTILPFYTAGADKAYDASKDLDTIAGNLAGTQSDAATATEDHRTAAEQLAEMLGVSAREFDDAADGAQEFSGALAELYGWLDRRAALREYEDAVSTLKEGLRDGFGRDDTAALDDTARSIADIASSMRNAARREDFLSGAIGSLRTLARSAGPEARREIQDVIGRLQRLRNSNPRLRFDADDAPLERKIKRALLGVRGLDKMKASPFVELYLGGLVADLGRAGRSIDGLGKKKARPSAELNLNPFTAPLGAANSGLTRFGRRSESAILSANGNPAQTTIDRINTSVANMPDGYVTVWVTRKERKAAGGLIGMYGGPITGPGGGTEDLVNVAASHGEFMHRKAAVDYYGTGAMEAINQMVVPKAALIGRYATGGQIGQPPSRPADGARLVPLTVAAGGTVRHVFEHRVTVTGELDSSHAVTHLRQQMHQVSQDNYDANKAWEEGRGLG